MKRALNPWFFTIFFAVTIRVLWASIQVPYTLSAKEILVPGVCCITI